jgi:hypothetical protein
VTGQTRRLLENLNDWFKTGNIPESAFVLPNTILTPLVIIAQLIQYASYLELSNPSAERGEDLYACSKDSRETLGFCTGLLSALIVSSSQNKGQIQRYGAVALRLGMLIGMVVDSQDASSEMGPSQSFATVWNSVEAGGQMARIVNSFPEVGQPTPVTMCISWLIKVSGLHFCVV